MMLPLKRCHTSRDGRSRRAAGHILTDFHVVIPVAFFFALSGCTLKKPQSFGANSVPMSQAFANGLTFEKNPLIPEKPDSKMAAYYSVTIQGVALGTVSVGQNKIENPGPNSFEMKLIHRIGFASLVSKIEGQWDTGTPESRFLQKVSLSTQHDTITEHQAEWNLLDGTATQTQGSPTTLAALVSVPIDAKDKKAIVTSDSALTLPFFSPPHGPSHKEIRIFSPFTGEIFSAEGIQAKFDADGFLNSAAIPWYGGLSLEFKRYTRDELLKVVDDYIQNPVELAWFSGASRFQADLKQLTDDAENCQQFAADAENLVKRKLPQVPYLVHRKIYNFRMLCASLGSVLRSPIGRSTPENALQGLIRSTRLALTEDTREQPRAFVQSPEINVLKDESRRWQWVKIVSHLLRQTHEELSQLLAIEQAQKSNVAIRVTLDKLTHGSVVKGLLRSNNLALKQDVEVAVDGRMKATSWTSLPAALLKPIKHQGHSQSAEPLKVADTFELLNGQAFARADLTALGLICEHFNGRVGIDLGDAPNTILSSSVSRGVWDQLTRVQLIREFARRSASHPSCRQVTFRVPGHLQLAALAEISAFKKDNLQTESEFQISNGSYKRMRLVPGSYNLVLSSLVTGAVLSRKEIIIPEGKDNGLMVSIR